MLRLKRPLWSLTAIALLALAAGCGGVAKPESHPTAPQQAKEPAPTRVDAPPAGSGSSGGGVSGNPGNGVPVNPTAPAPSPPPAAVAQPPSVRTLDFTTLQKGSYSGVTERKAVLIADPGTWSTQWQAHSAHVVPVPAAPAIDFSQYSVLAVYMGEKNTGGYAVEVAGVQLADGKLVVTVRQQSPGPGGITTQALTQPFHLIRIPKVPAGTAVEVRWL